MKVAVYTIALNEEQFVERWYNSAKDADYLLIADTGSTDKTVEIAKSLGINVIDIRVSPWRFDDARNAALAYIPLDIDYCISLDMDEIITPDWRAVLETALEEEITRPQYKHVWSWNDDGSPGLEFNYDHIHARKNYRWRHPVHECLYYYGKGQENKKFIEGIETHHHPDSTKSRSQYLPLLQMSVQEDPQNDRNAFYYARELYFYGKFAESAKEFKRHLSLPRAVWKPERAASYRYLAKVEPANAIDWLIKAANEAPNRREAWVDLAKTYYEMKQWQESLDAAEKAIAIQEKPLEYLCEPFAWGSAPYDFAAIAAYNLEDKDKAVEYGEKAVELNPNDERLTRNLEFYRS
jgi:glycosyltransferase involved in cell wall biosynthesis